MLLFSSSMISDSKFHFAFCTLLVRSFQSVQFLTRSLSYFSQCTAIDLFVHFSLFLFIFIFFKLLVLIINWLDGGASIWLFYLVFTIFVVLFSCIYFVVHPWFMFVIGFKLKMNNESRLVTWGSEFQTVSGGWLLFFFCFWASTSCICFYVLFMIIHEDKFIGHLTAAIIYHHHHM